MRLYTEVIIFFLFHEFHFVALLKICPYNKKVFSRIYSIFLPAFQLKKEYFVSIYFLRETQKLGEIIYINPLKSLEWDVRQ